MSWYHPSGLFMPSVMASLWQLYVVLKNDGPSQVPATLAWDGVCIPPPTYTQTHLLTGGTSQSYVGHKEGSGMNDKTPVSGLSPQTHLLAHLGLATTWASTSNSKCRRAFHLDLRGICGSDWYGIDLYIPRLVLQRVWGVAYWLSSHTFNMSQPCHNNLQYKLLLFHGHGESR